MKKLTALLMAALLMLSLPACGQSETPPPSPEPASAMTPEPTPEPTPEVKETLEISEIAEGTYLGTLSGDSYTNSKDDTYSISPDISPSELYLIIRDGQVTVFSSAIVSAGGSILGVDTPRSPKFTRAFCGTLPLSQSGEATVNADGDVKAIDETPWIYWDDNMSFTGWEVAAADEGSYHCSVSVAMTDGVQCKQLKRA